MKFLNQRNAGFGYSRLKRNYNRGQNSLVQMSFALKEAFPVCKLLPFTANAPPHCNVGRWKKTNSSMTLSSALNIAMRGNRGGGISTRNFLQNTKCVTSFVRDWSLTTNATSASKDCSHSSFYAFADLQSIELESLQNFEIKCVKCHCLVLSTEIDRRKLLSLAILRERAFLMSSLFSELQHS